MFKYIKDLMHKVKKKSIPIKRQNSDIKETSSTYDLTKGSNKCT